MNSKIQTAPPSQLPLDVVYLIDNNGNSSVANDSKYITMVGEELRLFLYDINVTTNSFTQNKYRMGITQISDAGTISTGMSDNYNSMVFF